METWKAVENTDGALEISSEGRMRSWLRGVPYVLKPQKDTKGYLRIRVTLGGERKTYKVHREVAKAFIPNPRNLKQVNHKDCDKTNNAAYNLEWISGKGNVRHAILNGRFENTFNAIAQRNENRKRSVEAINIYDSTIMVFESIRDAERALGTKHINSVINGERSQANGYYFRYAEKRR